MVKDWVLYSSETESPIENGPTVIFVSLSKSRILMELSQNLVKAWNRSSCLTSLISVSIYPFITLFHILIEQIFMTTVISTIHGLLFD